MTLFMAIILVACVLLVIILLFITLNRYISFKERVALAQLGFSIEDLNRDAAKKKYGNRGVLWGGVITAMSGLALLLGLATIGVGAWLLGGLLPLFVGLGMVLIYFMTLGPAPSVEVSIPTNASNAPEKSAEPGHVDNDKIPFNLDQVEATSHSDAKRGPSSQEG
jgi:hypothetical protein